MPTRVHSVLHSRERSASLQRNGERAKPYNDFRNREPSRASRSRSHRSSPAMLLARVQEGPHRTHHSIDVSDEIPEFLTSPRTSSIYTIEKVGKGSLATIVSFPEMLECDLCRPTPIGHSARHRVTAENAEVHSGSGGSVKRISLEEPTEVADMVPRNMAPPGGSFRWFVAVRRSLLRRALRSPSALDFQAKPPTFSGIFSTASRNCYVTPG